MAINFTYYPDSNRVPGIFVEMDPSQANTATTFQRSLVLGQIAATGTATPLVPFEVESIAQIQLACGRGSMLAQMAQRTPSPGGDHAPTDGRTGVFSHISLG